jgi:hypothetical protein
LVWNRAADDTQSLPLSSVNRDEVLILFAAPVAQQPQLRSVSCSAQSKETKGVLSSKRLLQADICFAKFRELPMLRECIETLMLPPPPSDSVVLSGEAPVMDHV